MKAWLPALAMVAVAMAWLLPGYSLLVLNQIALYMLLLLGMDLLVGSAGQFSLGHSAFFGVGVTVAATSALHGARPWPCVLAAGTVLAGLGGWLFALPLVRLFGPYLSLASMALAIVVPQLVANTPDLTGGFKGSPIDRSGLALGDLCDAEQGAYLLTLIVLAVGWWCVASVQSSRLGLAVRALRENPLAASAFGVSPAGIKAGIFALSAALAGAAGVLQTYATGFASTSMFSPSLSVLLVAAAVVGGLTSPWGPLLGALVLQLLPTWTQNLSKSAPSAIFGACLIACALLLPGGLGWMLAYLIGNIGNTGSRRGAHAKDEGSGGHSGPGGGADRGRPVAEAPRQPGPG